MSVSDPLQTPIFDAELHTIGRCAIINEFWDCDFKPTLFETQEDSYFRYYFTQCEVVLQGSRQALRLTTHRDVANIVQHLRSPTAGKDSVRGHIKNRLSNIPSEEIEVAIDSSLDLAVRLWLMISIGELSQAVALGQTIIPWQDHCIQMLLKERFTHQRDLEAPVKLSKIFNARNIELVAGIQIAWTDNLADHLRMRDDDKKVEIFHYASFLKYNQIYEVKCDPTEKVFPKGFVDETLRTLSFLLPQHDAKVKKWFSKHQKSLCLDKVAVKCGSLNSGDRQIEKFNYWHDRLVILKQAFDDTEPDTVPQWWRDRRKRVQWYTFWVAILVLALTVFFGVIQSIEGGLQVWKAYHP